MALRSEIQMLNTFSKYPLIRKYLLLGGAFILFFKFSLLCVGEVHAQILSRPESKGITITSEPLGVSVHLKGRYSIYGVTPFRIPYPLQGVYKIKAQKYGYESISTLFSFSGRESGTYSLRLVPKTRARAFLRSFIFPGWGQVYSDRKTEGIVLALLELYSLGQVIRLYYDYQNLDKDRDALDRQYRSAGLTFEKRQAVFRQLQNVHTKLDKMYNDRQKWIAISAAVWIYNILDALLFFNYPNIEYTSQFIPSISANLDKEELFFSWSFPF